MTNVYFHPEVARDIRESVVWYELQAKGLGGDFINELEVVGKVFDAQGKADWLVKIRVNWG